MIILGSTSYLVRGHVVCVNGVWYEELVSIATGGRLCLLQRAVVASRAHSRRLLLDCICFKMVYVHGVCV